MKIMKTVWLLVFFLTICKADNESVDNKSFIIKIGSKISNFVNNLYLTIEKKGLEQFSIHWLNTSGIFLSPHDSKIVQNIFDSFEQKLSTQHGYDFLVMYGAKGSDWLSQNKEYMDVFQKAENPELIFYTIDKAFIFLKNSVSNFGPNTFNESKIKKLLKELKQEARYYAKLPIDEQQKKELLARLNMAANKIISELPSLKIVDNGKYFFKYCKTMLANQTTVVSIDQIMNNPTIKDFNHWCGLKKQLRLHDLQYEYYLDNMPKKLRELENMLNPIVEAYKYFDLKDDCELTDEKWTEIAKKYRILSVQFHPDKGGSTDQMAELNSHKEILRKVWDNPKIYYINQQIYTQFKEHYYSFWTNIGSMLLERKITERKRWLTKETNLLPKLYPPTIPVITRNSLRKTPISKNEVEMNKNKGSGKTFDSIIPLLMIEQEKKNQANAQT